MAARGDVVEYIYRQPDGTPYLRVRRLPNKAFPQSHWNGSAWARGKPKGPKIPYRLPELIAAAIDKPVFVCEGEKDADRLAGLGFVATTATEGAGKWTPDLNQWFAGKTVYVLADNDEPGAKHARQVADNLTDVAAEVRIVNLPDLPQKGDVSDWLDAGGDPMGLIDLCQKFSAYPRGNGHDATADGGENDATATARRLAALRPFEYDKVRTAEAKRLGVRAATLDAEVERARPQTLAEDGSSDDFLADAEPWPSPINGAKFLDQLTATIQTHMVLPAGSAEIIALWVVHAHAHDYADVSPILGITSPTPECGKTTLLTILGGLVPRALTTANITTAALFRTIEKWRPTVLIDEADTFVADNDELRGVVNSGHHRANAFVIRTVGDDYDPKRFSTWAPKIVAMIGKLPETWASRAIHIELSRKTAADRVTTLRLDRLGHLEPLKRQAARFAADNAVTLRAADPDMPTGLDGRPADNWRPLLAIADTAGGDWPERARRIAQGSAKRSEATAGIMVLEDIRRILVERGGDRMASDALVKALGDLEDRPWPEWRNGKPITARQLARLLEPFKIRPGNLRMPNGTVPKGYKVSAFDDAFARYLPPRSATPLQAAENLGFDDFRSATSQVDVADRNAIEPAENLDCSGVADREGGSAKGYDPADNSSDPMVEETI